jgi:hypothetical protein
MSFPSAVARFAEGVPAEEALLYGMEHDTDLGFTAIIAVTDAVRQQVADPLAFIKKRLPGYEDDVLHCGPRGEGVIVDFAPLSKLGLQIARLMGTDAARPLMVQRVAMPLGFANCCGVLASPNEQDVRFSAEEQVRWQLNIHC